MPLILSGNVASATAGAYEVKNSCRFGTDTYMDKDNSASSPTHADKYTISFWCKKCQTSGGASGAPAEDGYLIFSCLLDGFTILSLPIKKSVIKVDFSVCK